MSAAVDKNAVLDERVQRLIAEALQRVRFGTVTLTIHAGEVQSVDVLEKTRLTPAK